MSETKEITEEMKEHLIWYKEADNQTLSTLPEFLRHLTEDYKHDYGTICHALAAGALATCKAMDKTPQGGIAGFQAGSVMGAFVKAWLQEKGPMSFTRYENMLYPQYEDEFNKTLPKEIADYIKEAAKNLLESREDTLISPLVRKHWKRLATGKLPFGYKIRD